jgi:hypothetical protein
LKVFIAIPCLSGDIKARTFRSIVQTLLELLSQGIMVDIHVRESDSIIPNARNVLTGAFLASDCTDLLWVDSDVSWEVGAVSRLLSHPVDFVAGAYRHKRDIESYPVAWLPKEELWTDENGLLEVDCVPFGFCRLTRACVEKMAEAHKDRSFVDKDAPTVTSYCLFDLEFKNGQYWGEDFVFCKRWQALGGKVHLDPEISLGHTGNKTFQGDIGKWLKKPDLESLLKEAIGG